MSPGLVQVADPALLDYESAPRLSVLYCTLLSCLACPALPCTVLSCPSLPCTVLSCLVSSPGLVQVADPALLDYESAPRLQLIVAAMAGGEHAYARLQVNLLDQNDNAPKFAQTKYVSAIWENNKPQTYVTQVRPSLPGSRVRFVS